MVRLKKTYEVPILEIAPFEQEHLMVVVSRTTGGTSDGTDIGDGGDDDGTVYGAGKRFLESITLEPEIPIDMKDCELWE